MWLRLRPGFTVAGQRRSRASERGEWPSALYKNLNDLGFQGSVYPVNPRRDEIWDVTCYADFASLPEPVDLALVVIPGGAVLNVLEEGTAHGLKSAVVFAANMGEGDDPEVVARGRALTELCERTGLRACGPNCMGIVSAHNKVFAYPNEAMCRMPAGNVAAVFQSGGAMMYWADAAAARGIRFSHMITSGNELDLVLADYVDYLIDDPGTDIIVLMIEAIRRPDAFMQAAARALASKAPQTAQSVALAGFLCNDAFREVSAQAIQLHGGIAYTQEHVAHLYWRRARATLSMFGDSDLHREAYLSAWEAAA